MLILFNEKMNSNFSISGIFTRQNSAKMQTTVHPYGGGVLANKALIRSGLYFCLKDTIRVQ